MNNPIINKYLTSRVIMLAKEVVHGQKEGEMPPVFKALASIMAWVLWIAGLVMGFSTLAMGIMAGHLFNPTQVAPIEYSVGFAVSLAMGVGAVVVMLLRKNME